MPRVNIPTISIRAKKHTTLRRKERRPVSHSEFQSSPASDATVPMRRQRPVSARLISRAACMRLIKSAGSQVRYSSDLDNPVTNDQFGTIHRLFKETLTELAQKSIAIMRGERKSTLLPRHIQQLGMILGIPVVSKGRTNLPTIALLPVIRYLRTMGPPNSTLRMSKDSVHLLIEIALDRTVLHIRSASGIAAVSKRQTIRKGDIQNASLICNDFPH